MSASESHGTNMPDNNNNIFQAMEIAREKKKSEFLVVLHGIRDFYYLLFLSPPFFLIALSLKASKILIKHFFSFTDRICSCSLRCPGEADRVRLTSLISKKNVLRYIEKKIVAFNDHYPCVLWLLWLRAIRKKTE